MYNGKFGVLPLDAKCTIYFLVCGSGLGWGNPPDSLLITVHKLLPALLSSKRPG